MEQNTPRHRCGGGPGNRTWGRTLPVSRTALPLLTFAVLASACSSSVAGEADSYRAQAASHCTEVVNDHLLEQADESGVGVLLATMEGEEPTADELAEWAESISADLERRESVRAALEDLSSDDDAEQAHWQSIVAAGDADLEFVRGRAELLGTQDWAHIKADFTPGGLPGALPEAALAALGLENSDCQWVHNPAVLAGSPDFVRAATTACTEVANRRFGADYAADAAVSLELLAEFRQAEPQETVPEGAPEALTRLHQEWAQTAADLEAVPADGASDPAAWDQVVAAAQERVEQFETRAEAASSGDVQALAKTYSDQTWEHPGADFAPLGLTYRSCAGVTF